MLSLFFTDHWITYLAILGSFMLILRLLKHFNENEQVKSKSVRRVRFRLPLPLPLSHTRAPVQEVPPEAF
jgi:hypothetical protein